MFLEWFMQRYYVSTLNINYVGKTVDKYKVDACFGMLCISKNCSTRQNTYRDMFYAEISGPSREVYAMALSTEKYVMRIFSSPYIGASIRTIVPSETTYHQITNSLFGALLHVRHNLVRNR